MPLGGEEQPNGTNNSCPPSNILYELAKSIRKRHLVRECFQGALNRSRQVAESPQRWLDPYSDSDDEDGVFNGNVEVSDIVEGPSDTAVQANRVDMGQLKWESIALTFLECHPLFLTPLLSETRIEPDRVQIRTKGMNYLHLAVLNSSAKIVKQLIANIQAHQYHKDHPDRQKVLMTALDSSRRNCLEIAISNDVLNAELIQCLLGAEKTLVHQTEKNGVK